MTFDEKMLLSTPKAVVISTFLGFFGIHHRWPDLPVFLLNFAFTRTAVEISYFVKVELLCTFLGPKQAVSNILDHG